MEEITRMESICNCYCIRAADPTTLCESDSATADTHSLRGVLFLAPGPMTYCHSISPVDLDMKRVRRKDVT